jgi:hypothetical protein
MNNFQKFVSLPAVTRDNILRTARRIARLTHNRVDYMSLADCLTEAAWERRQAHLENREHEARMRRAWQREA